MQWFQTGIAISNWWLTYPPEKWWSSSDWIIIPTIGENKTCSKSPTRYCSWCWYLEDRFNFCQSSFFSRCPKARLNHVTVTKSAPEPWMTKFTAARSLPAGMLWWLSHLWCSFYQFSRWVNWSLALNKWSLNKRDLGVINSHTCAVTNPKGMVHMQEYTAHIFKNM
jgi:hypothetical protein